MMIDNLIEFQDKLDCTNEFDLDGYIELVAVEKIEANLCLSFNICAGVDSEPAQL